MIVQEYSSLEIQLDPKGSQGSYFLEQSMIVPENSSLEIQMVLIYKLHSGSIILGVYCCLIFIRLYAFITLFSTK